MRHQTPTVKTYRLRDELLELTTCSHRIAFDILLRKTSPVTPHPDRPLFQLGTEGILIDGTLHVISVEA